MSRIIFSYLKWRDFVWIDSSAPHIIYIKAQFHNFIHAAANYFSLWLHNSSCSEGFLIKMKMVCPTVLWGLWGHSIVFQQKPMCPHIFSFSPILRDLWIKLKIHLYSTGWIDIRVEDLRLLSFFFFFLLWYNEITSKTHITQGIYI